MGRGVRTTVSALQPGITWVGDARDDDDTGDAATKPPPRVVPACARESEGHWPWGGAGAVPARSPPPLAVSRLESPGSRPSDLAGGVGVRATLRAVGSSPSHQPPAPAGLLESSRGAPRVRSSPRLGAPRAPSRPQHRSLPWRASRCCWLGVRGLSCPWEEDQTLSTTSVWGGLTTQPIFGEKLSLVAFLGGEC